MECVGAVIALNDKTQNLGDKIVSIERLLVEPANVKKKSSSNSKIIFSKKIEKSKIFNFFKLRVFKLIAALCLIIISLS